jgi:hypothetical protein
MKGQSKASQQKSLARNIVANTCKRFRSQTEAVIAADGSFVD